MPTTTVDKTIHNNQPSRIKRLLVVLSTAAVPETTGPKLKRPDLPKYLRYIDYV